MRIYLDNCCFNRPYDDQSQLKIKSETDSILFIQDKILRNEIELVWSYILDYENSLNPYMERRIAISEWKDYSKIYVNESDELIEIADEISLLHINAGDSLHVASSVISSSDYLITTDNTLIKKLKNYKRIKIINPKQFPKDIK